MAILAMRTVYPVLTLNNMEIHFEPELEATLRKVASEPDVGAEEIVQESVAIFLKHDQWFRQQVQIGLDQLDRGEFIEHDEVVARIERLLHPE